MYFVVLHLLLLVVNHYNYSIDQVDQYKMLLKNFLYNIVHLDNHQSLLLLYNHPLLCLGHIDYYYYYYYYYYLLNNLNKLLDFLHHILLFEMMNLLLIVYMNHIPIDQYKHLHHNVAVDQQNYHVILVVEHQHLKQEFLLKLDVIELTKFK